MYKDTRKMYKKLGTNSVMTIPMYRGKPSNEEAVEFLKVLKYQLKVQIFELF